MKTKPSRSDLEHTRAVVNGVVSEHAAKMAAKAVQPTQEELLVAKANAVIQEVRMIFLGQFKIRINPMSKDEATEIIRKMYLERYRSWTHDELLHFCALKDAVLAAQSLSDELI